MRSRSLFVLSIVSFGTLGTIVAIHLSQEYEKKVRIPFIRSFGFMSFGQRLSEGVERDSIRYEMQLKERTKRNS